MTEQEALYRSILEDPEDDTVRLVYADYLDENGQPDRAEFIRVQIELAKPSHCTSCGGTGFTGYASYTATCPSCRPEFLRLKGRESDLWNVHSGEWFGSRSPRPLPGDLGWAISDGEGTYIRAIVAAYHSRYFVRRGFVDKVVCAMRGLVAVGKKLFSEHPITAVVLDDRVPIGPNSALPVPDDHSWVRDHGYADEIGTQILPPGLWDMLLGYDQSPSPRVFARRYPTAAAAHASQADAALRWGRQLVRAGATADR